MARRKKSKTLTTVFAFFFGMFGVHRFYLGQRANGVIYLLLSFVGIGVILGIIDFLSFLFMDTETFDRRYNDAYENRDYTRESYKRYSNRKGTMRREVREIREVRETREVREPGRPVRKTSRKARPIQRTSPSNTRLKALIQSGKSHYDAFDFFEAIAQWEKALELSPDHVAVHFNLACAYSLTEQAQEGFAHLSQAVENGFSDMDKLKNQDALAFLRIQPEFEEFEKNNFRKNKEQTAQEPINIPVTEAPKEEKVVENPSILSQPDLLQQLKELGELRDRGLLTNEEFLAEKKKLL